MSKFVHLISPLNAIADPNPVVLVEFGIALELSAHIPQPAAPVESFGAWYVDNARAAVHFVVSQVNELYAINVERVAETAFKLMEIRYQQHTQASAWTRNIRQGSKFQLQAVLDPVYSELCGCESSAFYRGQVHTVVTELLAQR